MGQAEYSLASGSDPIMEYNPDLVVQLQPDSPETAQPGLLKRLVAWLHDEESKNPPPPIPHPAHWTMPHRRPKDQED